MKDGAKAEKALKVVADGQDLLATINDCTRARKCNLVPKAKKAGSGKVETADDKGCCPGQTGHHLINDAMIKDSKCAGYEYNTAPTVCVEGVSQNHGSHARVHDAMDREVGALAKRKSAAGTYDGTMSLSEAIDAAVKSHREAFPASGCSAKCIRAQLESYYKCKDARLKAVNKKGDPVRPDAGTNNDE